MDINILDGLHITGISTLEEVETRFGTSAARSHVKQWYKGEIPEVNDFYRLMNHFNQNTIKSLAELDWTTLVKSDGSKISVDKIRDIQSANIPVKE